MDWLITTNQIIPILGIVLIIGFTPFAVKRFKNKKQDLVLCILNEISVLLSLSGSALGSLFMLDNYLPSYMDLAGLALALLSLYWYAKATTSKRGQG